MRPHPIQYLNTDLDLASSEDLRPLVRALVRGGLWDIHVDREKGVWRACLETAKMARTPNGHITAMLKAVASLKPKARALWDGCRKREANLGYESGEHPALGQFNQLIPRQTLKRMAVLGLSMRITIYPPYREWAAKLKELKKRR